MSTLPPDKPAKVQLHFLKLDSSSEDNPAGNEFEGEDGIGIDTNEPTSSLKRAAGA